MCTVPAGPLGAHREGGSRGAGACRNPAPSVPGSPARWTARRIGRVCAPPIGEGTPRHGPGEVLVRRRFSGNRRAACPRGASDTRPAGSAEAAVHPAADRPRGLPGSTQHAPQRWNVDGPGSQTTGFGAGSIAFSAAGPRPGPRARPRPRSRWHGRFRSGDRARDRLPMAPRGRRRAPVPSLLARAAYDVAAAPRRSKALVSPRTFVSMRDLKSAPTPMPDVAVRPEDWRDQIRADLKAQLKADGTLYGFRLDGTCIARTQNGTRVLKQPARQPA